MPIDEELTDVLRPLARDGLKVWVPFFANTFPLAFYYARAAEKQASRDTWGTWSTFKEDPAKEVQIFYASKREVESLRACPIGGVILLDSCVTRYRPRWFFLEAATEIARRVRDSHGMFTSDATDVLSWYKGIEIVTDVRPTAQVVETFLTASLASFPTIRYVTATTFEGPPRQQLEGTLRAFFFGAPRTAVLKQQDELYTPIELPDDRFAAAQLDTHIVVAGNLGLQEGGDILRALESFHATLFAAANDIASGARGDSEFQNLWEAYAEIERVEQHRPAFREPKSYASCLRDHHGDGAGPPRQPVASTDSPPWHVHVGAGALGLGLVLPCLNHVERLVVLQRHGEKWDVLNRIVTLRNSQHWSRQFSCILVNGSELVTDALRQIETAVAKAPTLVVTDHREVWRAVLGHATAITYSIKDGQAKLGALLTSIPFTTAPTLYPFENVVDIGSLPPKLPRVQLILDRVCAKAIIKAKTIQVGCEPSGSIRYLLPAQATDDLLGRSTPSGGVEVHALRSMEEYRFYYRQKRYLMNGMHYVIAALSYDYLRDHGISHGDWAHQLVPILTNLILGEEQRYVKLIERFAEFQAVRLAAETDATDLYALFAWSPDEAAWRMCASASEVLERAKRVVDRLGRVLPPDEADSNLRKCREFLIESLRVMTEKRERIAAIRSPRGGALPDWFYAITAVLEAVLLAQHSTMREE